MVKQSEFVSYVKSLVGSRVDQDGYYGSQCVDLIMHVNEKYFGMRTWGNAIDYTANAMPAGYKRYTRSQTNPQPGDILVWSWGSWDPYGHIGICTAFDGVNVTSVEQNVDGGPTTLTQGGPARYRTRTTDCLAAILRPPLEIDVRNEPTAKGTPVATYGKGDRVNYDSYVVANGYVWISYVSNSGTRRYMAIGEHDGYRRTSTWVHWV